MTTTRYQLSRRGGSKLAARAVIVARCGKCATCRPQNPTRRLCWGNPHDWRQLGKDQAVARFRTDLLAGRLPCTTADVRQHLAGHDLACWCPLDEPCHADVLLEVANQ